MTSWVRLWHDMPTDPKFRTIARAAKQPLPVVIAVFTLMLTDASANATERGRTTATDEDIASAFDLEDDAVKVIRAAMQGRVLDGDRLAGWEGRQPKREDESAARAKAWRGEQKRATEAERTRTQPNAEKRPEAETDAETDHKRQHPAQSRTRAELDQLETELRNAAGLQDSASPGLISLAPIVGLLNGGHDLELDVLPTLRAVSARAKRKPGTWDYFVEAIVEASAKRRGLTASGLAPPIASKDGGNIFGKLKQGIQTNGSVRDGRGDGPIIDAVRGISFDRGQEQRDDSGGVSDGDRGLHSARVA